MYRFFSRWGVALIFIATCIVSAPALGQEFPDPETEPDGGYGPNDRPVFMLISLEDTFFPVDEVPQIAAVQDGDIEEEPDLSSRVLLVQIGVYRAGFDIFDTRYEGMAPSEIDLNSLPLPINPDTGLPDAELLDDNAVTIIGAFKTLGDGMAHMVTPVPDPIPPEVQEAFFNACPFLNEVLVENPYPTASEIANFIFENQGDADASLEDIQDAVFASTMELGCTTCRAEGALFPHKPNSNELFDFDFELPIDVNDPNRGKLTVLVEFEIEIRIKGGADPAPFNLGSRGKLPVVIPTTDDFDAVAETNIDSLAILGVPVVKYAYEDADGDGDIDVVVHFDTQQLVAAGVDMDTTELTLTGTENFYNQGFHGVGAIKIVPPKGKGKGKKK